MGIKTGSGIRFRKDRVKGEVLLRALRCSC